MTNAFQWPIRLKYVKTFIIAPKSRLIASIEAIRLGFEKVFRNNHV